MENQPADDVPLSLYVNSQGLRAHFRRGRIIGGAVVISTFIAAAMLVLQGEGICIENFVDGEKTDEEIKSLLDYQNSITGTISSFIAKPVDFFLGMVVAAGFLCFATGAMLDRDGGIQWFYLPMLTGGALAFLFSNGLNSLNVQVITGALTEVISTADLAYVNSLQDAQQLSSIGSLGTTWNRSFAENASGSSVFNTILRTHLLTRNNVAPPCTGTGDVDELTPFRTMPLVVFDFQPRTWQLATLTTALKPQGSLKIAMNTPNPSQLAGGAAVLLPSPVNVSSNLVIIALMTLKDLGLDDATGSNSEYPLAKYAHKSTNLSSLTRVADVYNLSTASKNADKDDDDAAENFLKTSHALFKKAFNLTVNASVGDASVEYNRFNISANITFDSVTIELPVAKVLMNKKREVQAKTTDGFNQVSIGDYCSHDGCVIPAAVFASDGDRMTVQPRVQVARMCLNDDGSEDLTVFNAADGNVLSQCNRTSNNSMLVVSVGKRVEGDDWDASDRTAQFSNLRTVYSVTIGRLSWTTEDLADAFSVECAPDADCEGLRFQITSDSNTSDHLLSGASSLPLMQLGHFDFTNPSRTKWKYLVLGADRVESDSFDVLLPRRFSSVFTNGLALKTISNDQCSSFADDFVAMVEKNHLYMEQSLQTGYTAAFYFLFQNGVLQQTVNATSDSTTMNFAGNVQAMNVQVSIPLMNAIVSLVGCFLLIIGSVGVVIRAKQSERLLEERADADVVMEAMVDNTKYPSLLLDMGLRHDASSVDSTHVAVRDLRVERAELHHCKTSKHVFHVTSETPRPE